MEEMEEKVKEILNLNGYNLGDDVTLLDMIHIINQHKVIENMLEQKGIFIPLKRKVRYI